MKFTEYLKPDQIHQGVFLSCKKRALEYIGKLAAEQLNEQFDCSEEEQILAADCFAQLFKREKLGTTALANGVALPHAKLPSHPYVKLEKPLAIFIQLETAIDYEADDHKEVDLLYAVLFPENSGQECKTRLMDLAKRLNDKTLLKQLRAATSAEDLWHIFYYADQHSTELEKELEKDGISDH